QAGADVGTFRMFDARLLEHGNILLQLLRFDHMGIAPQNRKHPDRAGRGLDKMFPGRYEFQCSDCRRHIASERTTSWPRWPSIRTRGIPELPFPACRVLRV